MIELAGAHLKLLNAHAERDYPYECCGLLLGSFKAAGLKQIRETYAISNAREEQAKRTRFLIRPDELLRGETFARARELEVVGFYHSHPDHPAVPSEYDREHAWPTYSYVVVSVLQGQVDEVRSWELEADRSCFNEEEILRGN